MAIGGRQHPIGDKICPKRSGREAFVFLNGPFHRPSDLPKKPPEGSLVVAVDGGALHCLSMDWPIDLLLGDFDSLEARVLEHLREKRPKMEIRAFPKDKDETDFELALKLLDGASEAISEIVVLGGLGGRWDMTIANLLSPLAPDLKLVSGGGRKPGVVFRDGDWNLHLLSGPASLLLGPAVDARRVSLIALRGEGARATLNGAFKYPLSSGFLIGSLTKGLSNELGSAGGEVIAESGVLLVSVSPLSDEGFVRPAEVF